MSIADIIIIYTLLGLAFWMMFNCMAFSKENMRKSVLKMQQIMEKQNQTLFGIESALSVIIVSLLISFTYLSFSLIFWPILAIITVLLYEFNAFNKMLDID